LVQVWLIRESKTTGIASYFEAFESEVSAKDGLMLRCENGKLFLREPLVVAGFTGQRKRTMEMLSTWIRTLEYASIRTLRPGERG